MRTRASTLTERERERERERDRQTESTVNTRRQAQHRSYFCSRMVKMSSPRLNNVILIGCLCTYSTIFIQEHGAGHGTLGCEVNLGLLPVIQSDQKHTERERGRETETERESCWLEICQRTRNAIPSMAGLKKKQKTVKYTKLSPEMVNPRDIAGNAGGEEEEN